MYIFVGYDDGNLILNLLKANWCPDCRAFQPKLNEFYKGVNKSAEQLELVFVGSDQNEEDQLAHFKQKQGPWWMIPYDNNLRNQLKRKVLYEC